MSDERAKLSRGDRGNERGVLIQKSMIPNSVVRTRLDYLPTLSAEHSWSGARACSARYSPRGQRRAICLCEVANSRNITSAKTLQPQSGWKTFLRWFGRGEAGIVRRARFSRQ